MDEEALNDLLFSCSVVSFSLQPHRLQYARLPCPSSSLRACSNSCLLSRWHPLSSLLLPSIFPSLRVFSNELAFHIRWPNYWCIGTSASVSVLPMNIQGWFPLGLTGLISLQSKSLSRVFSSTSFFLSFFEWVGRAKFFCCCHSFGPWGLLDLSSLTRDWTHNLGCESFKFSPRDLQGTPPP